MSQRTQDRIFLFIIVLAAVNVLASIGTMFEGHLDAGCFGLAESLVLIVAVHMLTKPAAVKPMIPQVSKRNPLGWHGGDFTIVDEDMDFGTIISITSDEVKLKFLLGVQTCPRDLFADYITVGDRIMWHRIEDLLMSEGHTKLDAWRVACYEQMQLEIYQQFEQVQWPAHLGNEPGKGWSDDEKRKMIRFMGSNRSMTGMTATEANRDFDSDEFMATQYFTPQIAEVDGRNVYVELTRDEHEHARMLLHLQGVDEENAYLVERLNQKLLTRQLDTIVVVREKGYTEHAYTGPLAL